MGSHDDGRRRAYLDYAATAPFDERLVEVLRTASWANANALYTQGREAMAQLEDARRRIAAALGAHEPSEITFTSGGSESDSTAIRGLAKRAAGAEESYVVVSAIEHDAVLNAADSLKASGFRVKRLKPGRNGIVQPEALEELLGKIEQGGGATCLVCVMAVNNELGTVQPVRALAEASHGHGALFLADAVQALGKVPIDLEASGVDAAAFSAHKIGAPKGVGALYLRRGLRCAPLVYGGGQEAGLRSGTQNVPGALAFARAVEYAVAERIEVWERVAGLREQVLARLEEGGFAHGIRPTLSNEVSDPDDSGLTTVGGQVPHVLSLLARGLEGETMVLRADNAGCAVSAGSACSSGSLSPSHVLTALGIPRDEAFGSLRISFGTRSTQDDVALFNEVLPEILR